MSTLKTRWQVQPTDEQIERRYGPPAGDGADDLPWTEPSTAANEEEDDNEAA